MTETMVRRAEPADAPSPSPAAAARSTPEPPLGLWGIIKEDVRRNGGWGRPGARALVAYRCAAAALKIKNRILGKLVRRATRSILCSIRNAYGIELYATAKIGRRLLIGHQNGIVVHEYARIGDDCVIRQGVTMGLARTDSVHWAMPENAPTVGDRVDIGVGAVLMGDVVIGDDVRIFPNAVVVTNVPANSTVVSPMSRIMTRSEAPSSAA
jgi:serine O-acetyltransferase